MADTNTPNTLSLGMRVSSEFDDNALNDTQHMQANSLTIVEPYLGWSLSVPRARWTLNYRPGLSIGHPITIYDSRSQLLDTNLQLTITKRLQLRLHESLLQSRNAFDQLRQSELTPGSSVLDRPNSSIFAATREDIEQVGADLSYALSARSVVGASASFYRANYNLALNTQALGSAKSFGTHAFASYQLTRHHWVGFDYSSQDLISQRLRLPSFVQSLLYTDTQRLSPTMEISFFLGPQHLLTRGEPDLTFVQTSGPQWTRTNWSWAAGANYVWSKDRTSLALDVSRRITDGARLEGVVELFSTSARLRRQIRKHWKGELLFADARNRPIVSNFSPLSYISFAGGFSRALNQRLSIECQYWRLHETSSNEQLTGYLADHNRISISVLYDLKVPLQR